MIIISAVFLLALAAVEPISAATTGRPPWGTCTTKQEGDMCVLIDVPPPCGHHGVAIFNHTPPCTTCECVPTPSKEKPVEVCCDTKTVGDYSYTKVHWGSRKVPSNCLNDCVYTRDGQPGTKYCFAEGEQEVHCHDSTDCPNYGIDFAPNGPCDVKSFPDITSPLDCALNCSKVAKVVAWTWSNPRTSPNYTQHATTPLRCTCKSCYTPTKQNPYAISGSITCMPHGDECISYGYEYCDITNEAEGCTIAAFYDIYNPESCANKCLTEVVGGSEGWSWANNQPDTPNRSTCFCHDKYKPKFNQFFVSGPRNCDEHL